MATHSTASLTIPDVLLEIASNLSDVADISRLSRCDRMSRELTMPLLFRNICIPIQKATSVAHVLKKYPRYARRCSSFTLDDSTEEVTEMIATDPFYALFEHLAAVLLTLADNARVKSVWWCRKRRHRYFIPVAVPTCVWEALGKLSGSIEELHIVIGEIDENWVSCLWLILTTIRSLTDDSAAHSVSGCDMYSRIFSIAHAGHLAQQRPQLGLLPSSSHAY
jgi:hypothetical protein